MQKKLINQSFKTQEAALVLSRLMTLSHDEIYHSPHKLQSVEGLGANSRKRSLRWTFTFNSNM